MCVVCVKRGVDWHVCRVLHELYQAIGGHVIFYVVFLLSVLRHVFPLQFLTFMSPSLACT